MKDTIKEVIGKTINFAFDLPLCDSKPIILVGQVTETYAKILIAHKSKIEPKIDAYACNVTNLIQDDTIEYSAFVMKIDGLNSNTNYKIPIHIGSEVFNAAFRTQSQKKSSFSFLAGSCNLHGLKLLNNPQDTFNTLEHLRVKYDVDFMLHLGDQIYSDIPSPIFNPTLEYYCDKYFSAWSNCHSANTFLSRISNYMILDDHEIINNYKNRSDKKLYIKGIDAYDIFQMSHSPRQKNDLHYLFEYNRTPFFVLDTRTSRSRVENNMVSTKQEMALFEWLNKNKTKQTFKIIVTAIPFLVDMKNTEHDKWSSSRFRVQRNRIIDFIVQNRISNVVFLSGDVHCSLITESHFIPQGTKEVVTINEITSSPLNQIQHTSINKFITTHLIETENVFGRVTTSSYYDECSNVALIDVELDELLIRYFKTSDGNLVDSKTIKLKV